MRGRDPLGDEEPPRPSLKGMVRATGLLAILGLAAHKQQGSPNPQIILGGPELDAVLELAEELAEAGREDEEAVRSVRDAAKGRRRVLERALAFGGWVPDDDRLSDFRVGDRVARLLVAAATNQPVQPVSPEQESWFREIDAFEAGGNEAAYARLAAKVPSFAPMEQEVRTRLVAALSDDDDDWWSGFYNRLEAIVGPRSQLEDPLLRSGVAFAIAQEYLGKLAGVLLSDD